MRWCALLLLAGCAASKPELVTPPARSEFSTQALQLTLPRFGGGEPWSSAEDRGHVVLLDVWAEWCDPCRDSLPLIGDIAKQFESKGLKVYAINVDSTPAPIGPFLAKYKVELPVLLDPDAAKSEAVLRVKAMPTTLLLDKKGVIRHVHEGFDEEALGTWLDEIEKLLAE